MTIEELQNAIRSTTIGVAMEKSDHLKTVSEEIAVMFAENICGELDKFVSLLSDEVWLKKQSNKLSRWTRRAVHKISKWLKEPHT